MSLLEETRLEQKREPDGTTAAFDRARREVDVALLLNPDDDSRAMRDILAEMLDLYVRQTRLPESVDLVVHRDPDERKPTLHGRVTFTFRAEQDREQHYCFRVLTQTHHLAFQARLRAAITASGIDAGLSFRHLAIIRSDPPPSGKKTAQLVEKFEAAGGRFIQPSEDDLRTFLALRSLRDSDLEGFDAWLQIRQPLCEVALFREAGLCPPPFPAATDAPTLPPDCPPAGGPPKEETRAAGETSPPPTAMKATSPLSVPPTIPLGRRLEAGGEGREESLATSLLPRHTAIIAGAGSGKTVLLRRLVEEAALAGIPAIVVDVNNDLARLSEPWPERPAVFTDGDAAKARRYFSEVETIIWTPGLPSANPLSLSLLPNFSVLDDEDEREEAVQMARVTLLPFVGAKGSRGALKEGVLADALRAFARRRGGTLAKLTAFLGDLPDDVSPIDAAAKLARDMANQLMAKVATNPLLRAGGPALDPAILFEGAARQTRLSVINLSGLADDAQQSFVNQLQMTLFGWIKQNPSPGGRLYVMDEAQIFAPSGRSTPASESARALAAQARKYGLGMVLATQLPKGIDNRIVGNCITQFYGRQSAPATIQSAREMLAARGGTAADDIGRLSRAQFYFSTEGHDRAVKIKTPLCLSHHPANPLTSDEVEERARVSLERHQESRG